MKRASWIRTFLLGLALTGAMSSVSYADKCVPDPNAICPLIFAPGGTSILTSEPSATRFRVKATEYW